MLYRTLIRPILFLFAAEKVHDLTCKILIRHRPLLKVIRQRMLFNNARPFVRSQQNLLNLKFTHPVGLAAGFDKSGKLASCCQWLGFSFIESGSFTAQAQTGNSKPRLFRLPKQQAIFNAMGFNNPGATTARYNLQAAGKLEVPLGINIGKNRIVGLEQASENYLTTLRTLYDLADYLVINVSSPNTPQLRKLATATRLRQLLTAIRGFFIDAKQISKPVFVKLAPDLTIPQIDNILDLLLEYQCAGLILTNTQKTTHLSKIGGLSGQPLQEMSTRLIRHCYLRCQGRLLIIGCGGIMDTKSALDKIFAGASLIQLYTGLIYNGPYLAWRIANAIEDFLEKQNCRSVKDIIGHHASK